MTYAGAITGRLSSKEPPITEVEKEQIWLVEVGVNGWSRVCSSRKECVTAVLERMCYLVDMGDTRPLEVIVSKNGEMVEHHFV